MTTLRQAAAQAVLEALQTFMQPKPWVSLTDDEIRHIALDTPIGGTNFAQAIEEKLKEKNYD